MCAFLLSLEGGAAEGIGERADEVEVLVFPGFFQQAQLGLKAVGFFPVGVFAHVMGCAEVVKKIGGEAR